MYINEKEARIHNLIIRFYKCYSKKELEKGLTRDELSKKSFFREEDFKYLKEEGMITLENCTYKPTQKLLDQVEYISSKKKEDNGTLDKYKEEFIEKFEELKSNNKYITSSELVNLASLIHWYILPEYEEYMIVNREVYPNENPKEYYNHFHTLEDLYKELSGEGKNVKSKKGDMNLNREIEISICSRRWGHPDIYRITRTIEGWKVSLHQTIEGNKEGDALIRYLEHDLINYPNSLGSFMYYLWNKADREEMKVDELKKHLNDIAKWINVCEKYTPENIEE